MFGFGATKTQMVDKGAGVAGPRKPNRDRRAARDL